MTAVYRNIKMNKCHQGQSHQSTWKHCNMYLRDNHFCLDPAKDHSKPTLHNVFMISLNEVFQMHCCEINVCKWLTMLHYWMILLE